MPDLPQTCLNREVHSKVQRDESLKVSKQDLTKNVAETVGEIAQLSRKRNIWENNPEKQITPALGTRGRADRAAGPGGSRDGRICVGQAALPRPGPCTLVVCIYTSVYASKDGALCARGTRVCETEAMRHHSKKGLCSRFSLETTPPKKALHQHRAARPFSPQHLPLPQKTRPPHTAPRPRLRGVSRDLSVHAETPGTKNEAMRNTDLHRQAGEPPSGPKPPIPVPVPHPPPCAAAASRATRGCQGCGCSLQGRGTLPAEDLRSKPLSSRPCKSRKTEMSW